jgi:hypothetical protein
MAVREPSTELIDTARNVRFFGLGWQEELGGGLGNDGSQLVGIDAFYIALVDRGCNVVVRRPGRDRTINHVGTRYRRRRHLC